MKKTTLFLIILSSFRFVQSQNIQFVENKGQWNSLVTYKTTIGSSSLFLEKDGYRMLMNNSFEMKEIMENLSGHSKAKNNAANILHSHAYEMKFENAELQPEVIAADPLSTYNNYFVGKDQSKWASHCNIYQSIIYKNIYKGIDVRYYQENNHFKYDFIIHPGSDPKKIKLLFKGVNGLGINNKDLVIKTSVGDLSELKPFTYQLKNNSKINIDNAFIITGNSVSFKLNNYDKTADLIIDPTLIFSSYVGSTSDDWGYCSTYDSQGNFFAGSVAFHDGFPVNLGAYQTVFHGGDGSEGDGAGNDIAIFKFSANGSQRLYATYLGGSGDEQPQSLIADKNDNLIITGRTTSADFPVTLNTYGAGGNFDVYVSKLSADGSALLGSRKIGGSGADGVNIVPKYIASGTISTLRSYGDDSRSDVAVDDTNIYIVGTTRSLDFPTTTNAFKKVLGGLQDGFFIKASSDLSTIYNSSFVGGNNDDAVFSINKNKLNGVIYLAGATKSTDLGFNAVSDASGIIHKNFAGGETDGFVSELSSNGNILKRTVYIGTQGNDMVYELSTDITGSPYITGTTTKTFPVINATWSQVQSKQFITKLDTNLLSVQYSTNFGKNGTIPDISPIAFTVDKCENVYVVGWGGKANKAYYASQSVSGLTTTNDALSKNTDGNDFYIFALSANAGKQLFGSFYGTNDPAAYGDHIDGASSRFDDNGNLYLATCANCAKIGTFPTTTGSWSTTNPAQSGALCNFAGVKINFNFNSCVLATKIINLKATYQNSSTYLNWQTVNEDNVNSFIIQQSIDGINYLQVEKVEAKGNNLSTSSYSETLHDITPGTHYYRLQIIDNDGTYTYSNTVSIIAQNNGKPYIYVLPNPSKNSTTVYFEQLADNATMIIINSTGKIVMQQNILSGKNAELINSESLPVGVYHIVLVTKNNNKYKTSFLKTH